MTNFTAHFIISAFVALVDIIPLLARRHPWRYNLAMYWQALVTGIVIFSLSLPGLSWWMQGPLIAVALSFPFYLLPAIRGAYVWYVAVFNSLVLGFVYSLILHSLPQIAGFFSTAA